MNNPGGFSTEPYRRLAATKETRHGRRLDQFKRIVPKLSILGCVGCAAAVTWFYLKPEPPLVFRIDPFSRAATVERLGRECFFTSSQITGFQTGLAEREREIDQLLNVRDIAIARGENVRADRISKQVDQREAALDDFIDGIAKRCGLSERFERWLPGPECRSIDECA